LVFIRQIPFSLVRPNIFLKTFLSKSISLSVIISFSVHVSHEYVTTERYSSTLSLTSALDGVGGQRQDPAALPLERTSTHCIGGWVGHRAGLDGCGKSRSPTGIRSPDRPARSGSLYWLSYH
jgi:hypothetical protein